MKKCILFFLILFFFSFTSVCAEDSSVQNADTQTNQESIFTQFIKIFFEGASDGSNSNNNSQSPSFPQENVTPGSFPVTDPLPLLNNQGLKYSPSQIQVVQKCLQNKSVYEQASTQTGIPWQVLAGIHHKEGSCASNQSLVSGRIIGQAEPDIGINCSSLVGGAGVPKIVPGGCGFASLLDSAIYAGVHLKNKISKIPTTQQELAKALSRYNGGGNSNCRGGTKYAYCPPAFEGEDDTYVFNKNPDGKHETMYLRYCADYTPCNPPVVYAPLGALTAAGIIDYVSKL